MEKKEVTGLFVCIFFNYYKNQLIALLICNNNLKFSFTDFSAC